MTSKKLSKGKKRLVFIAFIGGLFHMVEELLFIINYFYHLIF